MALRLLRVVIPTDDADRALEILDREDVEPLSRHPAEDDRVILEILLEADESQNLLDELEKAFQDRDGFRMVVLAAEAAIPRLEEAEDEDEEGREEAEKKDALRRVSREEIRLKLADAVEMDRTYLLLAVLSSVVATVGILNDSTAVVIGAMVIAPLLGPMVALALATTLADLKLGWDALLAGVVGTAIALALSAFTGWLAPVDAAAMVETPQVASRISLGYGDLVLSLAAGGAGVLSMTAGVAAALVGVMVAVALLPPLVAAGLLLGAGAFPEAGRAFLAFSAYVIGINLAGVVTFLAQGIQPLSWWEADRARKATRRAIGGWLVLLLGLAALFTWLR